MLEKDGIERIIITIPVNYVSHSGAIEHIKHKIQKQKKKNKTTKEKRIHKKMVCLCLILLVWLLGSNPKPTSVKTITVFTDFFQPFFFNNFV